MPDSPYSRFAQAAMGGLSRAAEAVSPYVEGAKYLLAPTDLQKIGIAEQGSWNPNQPIVSATSAEQAPARTAGAPTMAERAAFDYNRRRPTPSIAEEALGKERFASIRPYLKPLDVAANVIGDPLQGSPGGSAAAILPSATRGLSRASASPAFSLQGALDDILAGGGDEALEAVTHIDPRAARTALNASGESAASMEAMGRRAWEGSTGRQLVRIDRAGRETPFIGEPGDVRLNPGERVGYRTAGGFEELNRGR